MDENKTVNDMTDSEIADLAKKGVQKETAVPNVPRSVSIPPYPCTNCPNQVCNTSKSTKSKECPKWRAWFNACWRFTREKYGIDFK